MDGKSVKKAQRGIIRVLVILCALVILLIFVRSVRYDVLKGTWNLDGTTIYQFDGKGEGNMILPQNTYSFKYAVDKEKNMVSIDFEDEKATDFEYSYSVKKKKLTLYGSMGEENFEYVFIKQKK